MADGILGNAIGAFGFPKTYILTDENGNEIIGTYVESETIFTATDNDVREGMVYASDKGVSTGNKVIPAYHTLEGTKLITAGSNFILRINGWDYTKLQCLICKYNSSISNSVATDKVVINNNVYNVQEAVSISEITKDEVNQLINLGISNTSDTPYVIRYFTYKEID